MQNWELKNKNNLSYAHQRINQVSYIYMITFMTIKVLQDYYKGKFLLFWHMDFQQGQKQYFLVLVPSWPDILITLIKFNFLDSMFSYSFIL